MFRPVALYIGLRYTRAKRRNNFISFISLVSMIGIALGVAVLITVLSVINGFDYQIKHRFFSIVPAVTIMTGAPMTSSAWQSLEKVATNNPDIIASAPYVNGKGMIAQNGEVAGMSIMGIDPAQEDKVSVLNQKMVIGSLRTLVPNAYHIVIGKLLANALGVKLGDKITLFTPQTNTTPLGIIPTYKRFTISGIYHLSAGFDYDNNIAFVNMQDAAKVFAAQAVSGLHLQINNIYDAPQVSDWLARQLPPSYMVVNWTTQFGAFFQALAMEKTIMFIMLMLIVAVAVFNLVATLVMVVTDKRADIAILRTIGATRSTILWVFVVQGAVVGIIGTLFGLVGGVLLAINAPALSNGLQNLFHVHLISSSVYFIDYLPSRLEFWDVVKVCLSAFALSLLATLYPAWQAFRIQPAQALRYE